MSEVKIPSCGRVVHFFPNGADVVCQSNGAECLPAFAVQHFSGTRLNLSVFPMCADATNVLRYSVPHKSEVIGEFVVGEPQNKGLAYWDWPEIKLHLTRSKDMVISKPQRKLGLFLVK
jgi:hypothetical protein